MRLARVDLFRYGHLTDVGFDLPARQPDFHILVGANEVGKSTTQAALADLLFGFGHKTDYAFLHPERDLRIGAVIEDGPARLEARRRKGRKDTLLDRDDTPLDETALSRHLAGMAREGFLNQFSLNHERLRAGGRAILEEKDDFSGTLFRAAAGLETLTQRLQDLDAEARALFRPTGASQVSAALKLRAAATKAVKDAAGSARDYQDARRAEAEAGAALADRRRQLAELRARKAALTRIQRVFPNLRTIDSATAALEALGVVPPLPAEFRRLLQKAVDDHAQARRAVATARDELARAETTLDQIMVDEATLARADEIEPLSDQVGAIPLSKRIGAILKAASDRPTIVADLVNHEDRLARLLHEVGRTDLSPRTIGDHLPTRATTDGLRRLAQEHALLLQTRDTTTEGHEKARRALDTARAALDAIPAPRDAEPLRAAIRAAKREAGLATAIRQTDDAATKLRDAIARKRSALVPAPPDGMVRAALPSAAAVATYASDLKTLDDRLADLRKDARAAATALAKKTEERGKLLATGDAVTPERLSAARERRDAGWRLVRRQYVEGVPDPDGVAAYAGAIPLADAVETALVEADRLADRRFEIAETSARLVQLAFDITGLETGATELARRIAETEADRHHLLGRWRDAWTGLAPEPPAAMATWLAALEEIEGLRLDLGRLEQTAAGHRATGTALRDRLAAALAPFSRAPSPADDLAEVAQAAEELDAALTARDLERKQATKVLAEKQDQTDQTARKRETAERALDQWRTEWAAAMARVNRPPDTDPADLKAFLDAWDDIRGTHEKAEFQRKRIAGIQRDHDAFTAQITELAAALAPDLAARPSVEAASILVTRFNEARQSHKRRAERSAEVGKRNDALAKTTSAERAAETALADRLTRTGADSVEAAWPVVERAEERARLTALLDTVRRDLAEAGQGRSEADLRAECGDLDPDAPPALIDALSHRDTELVEESNQLSATLAVAREKLEGFNRAGAEAAEAAAEAARAGAEATRAAERYIRAKATALALRHAIERYRKENEGPLLGRASALFAGLTLGRYGRLTIDHDGGDKPHLLAQPADGGRSVPVDGLSDGARDQLFLALRLAAIDQVVASGVVLPFVADDLFINFDDDRAAAGLEALADLATRTQVLFFTHHRHLADLAERRIPGRFNRPSLGP